MALVPVIQPPIMKALTTKKERTVVISLFCTVIVAKTIGCTLPIGAKVLKLDPAIMASPMITTIVDAVSLMVYFNLACHLLDMTV